MIARTVSKTAGRDGALAHKLSAQLREAQDRINQLELEAEGLLDQPRSMPLFSV
jgi:hypothetical protein